MNENLKFSTPILLNVFNRPYETQQVLNVLRSIQAPVIYVHCDGPRQGNDNDLINVKQVKRLIDEQVDWDCEVYRMYEDTNQGCGKGPYKAIDWFFSNEEQGIILEDDCLPNIDFFIYCQILLDKYRNDERIGIISGTNNKDIVYKVGDPSYFFSAWTITWGWATWKRVWNLYDYDMSYDQKELISKVGEYIKSKEAIRNFLKIIARQDELDAGKEKSYWDYQLTLSLLYNKKYTIRPVVNLVSNIGFNERATHTMLHSAQLANRPTVSILPIIHPENVCIKNHHKDNGKLETPIFKRIKRFIKRFIYRFI